MTGRWLVVGVVVDAVMLGTVVVLAMPAAHQPARPAATVRALDCYPLTRAGACYQPGAFCPPADHGVTGVAGDGATVTCLDVSPGWLWDPS